MNVFKVSSLPLKEVIESLALAMDCPIYEKCKEYYLDIPPRFGVGQIRGINFDNGLGIIIYRCKFLKNARIEFTVDDVHPIKYIYTVQGPIKHSFANEDVEHNIEEYKCAIVASEKRNGHTLLFEKDTNIELVSLEINREKFLKNTYCELNSLAPELQTLFKDSFAEKTFYHDGFYGLKFRDILSEITKFQDQPLARIFYLESLALQIFVRQLVLFEDDLLNKEDSSILRVNELKAVDSITKFILDNISDNLSIPVLSKEAGINPNKLQKAFKHSYNTTVNEFITNTRLEQAFSLLNNNELSILDVALTTGFESNSYFTKKFKKKYGVTPTEFRNFKT